MLVFSTNKELKLSNWDKEYSMVISNRLLTNCFRLIDSKGIIAHESTLYKFTPLAISSGYFGKVIGNCKTHKEHKGKGLYGAVVTYITVNYCLKNPILFVDDNNIASKKGLQKIGFEAIGRFKIKNKYLSGLFYSVEKY
jgi:hypothetical protein